MPAEAAACDNCGKDVAEGDIAARSAGSWRGALLCPACLTRARAARARRVILAGTLAVAALGSAVLLWRDAPKASPSLPPAVDAPLEAPRETDGPADAIASLRREMAGRLTALERPSGAGAEDLAALAGAVDQVRVQLADFEARLAQLETAAGRDAPDPQPPAGPDPVPDLLTDAVRRDLADADPRKRLAGLSRLAELPSPMAVSLVPALSPLAGDEYGYVRSELARKAGELALAGLAPALIAQLPQESDLLARDQICRALGAITGIPYDPSAHTGEMLARQIERWRAWTESR